MTDSPQPWWYVAAAAALTGAITKGPDILDRILGRRADHAEKREEREAREMDTAREKLTTREAALFARVEAERDRALARLEDADRDRDRGWDLARFWHGEAVDMRHCAANARQQAIALARAADHPLPDWSTSRRPDLTLPPFENPDGERR